MNGEFVTELADRLQKPMMVGDLLLRPDDWAAHDPAALIQPGPQPKPLTVATLGAVRSYLKANRDGLTMAGLVVHVAGPDRVEVYGPLDARTRSRESYVSAGAVDLLAGFLGRYMPLEEFLIGLQTRFADADMRKDLLRLLSNVKDEKVRTALDDGVTQTVQARAGVALVSDVAVPNPVLLVPYRSFRDIVQPSCLFVLRVQSGREGGLPSAGLWEGDGGAWRITAIARVADWLVQALAPDVAVLA